MKTNFTLIKFFIGLTLLASLSLKEIILNLKRSLTWTAKVQDKGSMSYARNKITLFEKFSFLSKCLNLATCPFCLLFQNKINFKNMIYRISIKSVDSTKKLDNSSKRDRLTVKLWRKMAFWLSLAFFVNKNNNNNNCPPFALSVHKLDTKTLWSYFFHFVTFVILPLLHCTTQFTK